ncbi:MAG: hypothetical protein JWO36_4591 [Myxococcales bacterium]|nr:hypothetical protein [Myxococcales bacterium]
MTTFCDLVTPRCEVDINAPCRLDTKVMGEAMASASESQPSGEDNSGAGAKPSFRVLAGLVVLLAACGDDGRVVVPQPTISTKSRAAADPAEGIATDLDGAAPVFSQAVIAELTGDDASARAGFENVLRAADEKQMHVLGYPDVTPPGIAARAALHLAQMEARDGKNRHALDLVARAVALAPNDAAIAEGVAQLQADVVAASGAGDIRGPRLGTALPGVDPKVADAFGAAERALAKVHELRPRLYIEKLSASIRAKEDATEDVAARYRAVAEHGGLAQIASDYRIGSLYQDLGLGLLFEPLPAELDPAGAAGLRRTLRASALAYVKRAVVSYRASLAGPALPDSELWRLAADTDLHGALAILGEAGEGSSTH